MDDDEDADIASATAEERQMAQRVFDALNELSPEAFIAGDPRHGRTRITFDGEFNVIEFVRRLRP